MEVTRHLQLQCMKGVLKGNMDPLPSELYITLDSEEDLCATLCQTEETKAIVLGGSISLERKAGY
jgi:hypothetical protein